MAMVVTQSAHKPYILGSMSPPLLQNQQVLRRSFSDRGEWNSGIESNEPSSTLNRESKQVHVGQLPRSMNSGRIHDGRIQQADFIRPKFMDILMTGRGQMLDDSLNW